MSEDTPTTRDVRVGYTLSKDNRDPRSREARYNPTVHAAAWVAIRDRAHAEFDRWLAEHDWQVAVDTLQDAADDLRGRRIDAPSEWVEDVLRARAWSQK